VGQPTPSGAAASPVQPPTPTEQKGDDTPANNP
jgi:hypothetical protein